MDIYNVLLVSELQLKQYTNLNKNVDINLLRSEVEQTQRIDLQTILGTKFYKELLSKVTSTGNTFNDDEKILVDQYVQPWLIQQSYWQVLPHIAYQVKNRGIVQGDMENASAVDLETIKYLRTIAKSRADYYLTRMQDYLNIGRGQGKFPAYTSQNTLDGQMPSRSEKYNNGIYMPRTSRYGWNNERMLKNIKTYAEQQIINPPCLDCQ